MRVKNEDVVIEKDGRGQRMVRRGRNRVEEMQNLWKIKTRVKKGE